MAVREPQSANDYDNRTTEAVKSVLIEIGQILGSFAGKFAVVGGSVPWLLLRESDTPHVGTRDVDLSLDAEALADGEYARLVDTLRGQGYQQRNDLRRFQLIPRAPGSTVGNPFWSVAHVPRDHLRFRDHGLILPAPCCGRSSRCPRKR